jgi:hypothetical protein
MAGGVGGHLQVGLRRRAQQHHQDLLLGVQVVRPEAPLQPLWQRGEQEHADECALEEHNNSLLHKEALHLQMASKEKLQPPETETPVYVKGWFCWLVDPAPCDCAVGSLADPCR